MGLKEDNSNEIGRNKVHGQAGSGEQMAKQGHTTGESIDKSRARGVGKSLWENGRDDRAKTIFEERVSGRNRLQENNRIRTALCMDGIRNRGADRQHLQGKGGREPRCRDLVRKDRKMCTSTPRTGANRRSEKATRSKTIELGQPRASGARSSRREALTWKLGYLRKRLPVGSNQKTNLSTS